MTDRRYPDDYAPGPKQHWAINQAWEVLDAVPEGLISFEARVELAPLIAGKLERANRMGREAAPGKPYAAPASKKRKGR